MKLLLDSAAFLTALMEPENLGRDGRAALTSPETEAFVSVMSFWELSLKYSLGQLELKGITPSDLPTIAEGAGFSILGMDAKMAATFHSLPQRGYKDPFDRMLVWQAIRAEMSLLSKDPALNAYTEEGLKVIW